MTSDCKYFQQWPAQSARDSRHHMFRATRQTWVGRRSKLGRSIAERQIYDVTTVSQTARKCVGQGSLANASWTKELDDHDPAPFDSALKEAPDFALDRADYVDQRPLGIDANNTGTGKGEAVEVRDAFTDDGGIHVRLASFRGFGEDVELDDQIRRYAASERIGRSFESAQPARSPGQTSQQRPVVEADDFILWISIGDDH